MALAWLICTRYSSQLACFLPLFLSFFFLKLTIATLPTEIEYKNFERTPMSVERIFKLSEATRRFNNRRESLLKLSEATWRFNNGTLSFIKLGRLQCQLINEIFLDSAEVRKGEVFISKTSFMTIDPLSWHWINSDNIFYKNKISRKHRQFIKINQ